MDQQKHCKHLAIKVCSHSLCKQAKNSWDSVNDFYYILTWTKFKISKILILCSIFVLHTNLKNTLKATLGLKSPMQ